MDITRLPVVANTRAVNQSNKAIALPVGAVYESMDDAMLHSHLPIERVIQGELLNRRSSTQASTQSFLIERNLNQALPADTERSGNKVSPHAVSSYANHVRPEPTSELTQGKAVDYFV